VGVIRQILVKAAELIENRFHSAMHAAVTAEQFCDKTNVRFIGAIGSGGKRWNAWLATPWRPSTTPACCSPRKRSRRRIRSDRAQGSDRL